jgi:hypothetical protein
VRGNVTHALRALGGPVASVPHGQGGVHGEARAGLAQGIGRRGRHGAGGEVTGQGVVGGALPRSSILGGHGHVLGRAWGGRTMSLRGGVGLGGQQDGVHPLGVSLVEQKGEREGFWQGLALGSPPSL